MPTFESQAPIIRQRWQGLEYRPGYERLASQTAGRLASNAGRYIALASACTVPPAFIMIAHERESGANFNTYLGNGDPINAPTVNVPRGRGGFGSFEEGALDAIRFEGLDKLTNWSVELLFYWLEAFNGWGYFYRGIPSPYIWAGTLIQLPGKYVADDVYDATVMDPQLGCAIIYRKLIEQEPALALPA